jgi:SWI/SNF chromatin-remodeling complex subunit SWI1
MSTPHMQQPHMQQPGMYQQGQPGQQRPANNLEQQKMLYQMQLQQQLQQRNLMAAQRTNMPPNANPMAKVPMAGPNGQFAGMRPQAAGPQQARGGTNPENFMKSLATFMQTKNLPLDANPIVGDRSIALMTLYMTVVKFGGFKKVTAQNGWGQVAQALQFHPMQHQNAPAQLKGHYERNLLLFEEAWQMNQQRQRAAMMQQGPALGGPGPQMSPTKQMNPQVAMQQPQNFLQQQQLMGQQPQQHLQQQHPQTTPVKQMSTMHHPQQAAVNGFSTPQPQGMPHPMAPQSHTRNSLSRTVDVTPPQNGPFAVPSPMSAKAGSLPVPSPLNNVPPQTAIPPPQPQDYILSAELVPKVRQLDTWGGIDLDSLEKLGKAFAQTKPDVPAVFDLGVMDIHALTMSLQCGIHAEVRLALDTLATMSVEPRLQLDLRACDDLVEVLVDCAELQVELLAENAAEVSDMMLINSYEDVVRGARCEQEVLQDIPAFGSPEYELDRAVDKLICITTIMRNLSFYEMNHNLLADDLVIKFLCVVIRYLGTRNMLLRTHQNTLDFMKDVIIFLSNLAQAVELPGREQALCLLHFLLAFAPCPPPNAAGESVSFASYDPAVHRYLPPAVDSLAKLLARDEPNRSHYKTIFASDVASSPPYDLLTRTFGLAISPIPEDKHEAKRANLMPVTEARKPFLMQGMLAAEILSNLAPGHETGIAKAWLTSEDGFSQNLCRLILLLCLEASPSSTGPQHQRSQPAPKGVEDEALLRITMGGIAVLRRLAEKSRDPDDPNSLVPFSGLPPKEALLAALKIVQPRLQGVLKQLCAYAGLGT